MHIMGVHKDSQNFRIRLDSMKVADVLEGFMNDKIYPEDMQNAMESILS